MNIVSTRSAFDVDSVAGLPAAPAAGDASVARVEEIVVPSITDVGLRVRADKGSLRIIFSGISGMSSNQAYHRSLSTASRSHGST